MKQKVFRVFGFLFCLLSCLFVAQTILTPKDISASGGQKFYRAKGFMAEEKNSLDMLAFGNSDLYSGFIPAILFEQNGMASYSSGVSKQDLDGLIQLLELSFTHQQPKIVLIETDLIFYYKKRNIGDKFAERFLKYFPIFEIHERWKRLTIKDFTSLPKNSSGHIDKGYVFSDLQYQVEKTDYMKKTDKIEVIKAYNIKRLEKIIHLCQEKNIQLLFTEFPSAYSWDYAKSMALTQFFANRKLDFIDFNLEENLENIKFDFAHDFRDNGNHLNYKGAIKITNYLHDYLTKHYANLLQDHRDEEKYQSFHKAIESFYQQVNQK